METNHVERNLDSLSHHEELIGINERLSEELRNQKKAISQLNKENEQLKEDLSVAQTQISIQMTELRETLEEEQITKIRLKELQESVEIDTNSKSAVNRDQLQQEVIDLRRIAKAKDKTLEHLIDGNEARMKKIRELEECSNSMKAELDRAQVFWQKALTGEQELHCSTKKSLSESIQREENLQKQVTNHEEAINRLRSELRAVNEQKKELLEKIDLNLGLELEVKSLESMVMARERQIEQLIINLEDVNIENMERKEKITLQLEQQQRTRETMESLEEQIRAMNASRNPEWLIEADEVNLTDEKLGSGAFGEVNVALFRGTRVAAKKLHDVIISPYNRDKFIREMNISATVRHPNIVQFIGTADETNPILLYELMSTSLYSHLQKGQPLTRPQIIEAGCDIAAGLAYLHLHKPHPIIHRDVCSPNVLMDPLPGEKWRCKLSDLGAANLQSSVGTQSKYPGNPRYAALEAGDPSSHTPSMDVYSFGVLLMETTLCKVPESSQEKRCEQSEAIKWDKMKNLVQHCISDNHTVRPSISTVLDSLKEA